MKPDYYLEEIIEPFNHLKVHHRKVTTQQKVGRGAGFVLSYLYNQTENVTPSEIGKQMNVSTPNLTIHLILITRIFNCTTCHILFFS